MKFEKVLENFEKDMWNYWTNEKQQKWEIIKALLINASDDDVLSLINCYQREIMCECEFFCYENVEDLLDNIYLNDVIYTLVEDLSEKDIAILRAIKDVDSLIGCWEMCSNE